MHNFISTFLTASYDRNLNAVVATWNGYVQPEEAKTGFEKIWELFRYSEASYVLTDLREHEGGFGAITDWLAEVYMPKMIAAGYEACANIMPEEFFMYVSLNDFEDKQAGIVPLRVFDDSESARNWLNTLHQENQAKQSIKAVA